MQIATIAAADLARPLFAYATRFHAAVGDRHHVASPLGAWILLALCASSSDGRLRDELTKVLGIDVDTAAAFAAALLAAPHPAVASAAGIWTRPGLPAEDLSRWLARLPLVVDRGDLPTQATLDAWARDHTLGLIDRFPVRLDPDTLLLLATALATRVSWGKPFVTVPASELGRASAWSTRLKRALESPGHESHSHFIASTERAGDIAVHTVNAKEGLSVTSVIAERGVRPSDVLATAYELATAVARGENVPKRSLFDLPLGESPLWTIEEQPVALRPPKRRAEWHRAVLPAWSATTEHNLGRAELGFPAAAAALGLIAGESDVLYEARQSVLARYTRTGFEAAAVTVIMEAVTAARGPRGEPGVLRIGTLRFGHPFAVVAVTTDSPLRNRATGSTRPAPWHGLPVFSAWITEPRESEEDERELDEWDLPEQEEVVGEYSPEVRELLDRQRRRMS